MTKNQEVKNQKAKDQKIKGQETKKQPAKDQKVKSHKVKSQEIKDQEAKDHEEQSSQIARVISLGREQNYLTYAQINDLMPNIVDTENIDVIIGMLENMNIRVYEHPPSE